MQKNAVAPLTNKGKSPVIPRLIRDPTWIDKLQRLRVINPKGIPAQGRDDGAFALRSLWVWPCFILSGVTMKNHYIGTYFNYDAIYFALHMRMIRKTVIIAKFPSQCGQNRY